MEKRHALSDQACETQIPLSLILCGLRLLCIKHMQVYGASAQNINAL
jgi:hypothetical protein